MAIDAASIENILRRLEFDFEMDAGSDETAWWIESPSHRFDIAIEADLIEEISRIIGYDALPVTRPTAELAMLARTETRTEVGAIKQILVNRGYNEAINYSFVDGSVQASLTPDLKAVELKNPLSSDMSVMRTSLLPGLLSAVAHNQNRQQWDLKLFEVGTVFSQQSEIVSFDGIDQRQHLSMVLTGRRLPERWSHNSETIDFFDLKGDVEAILGRGVQCDSMLLPGLQQGQSASLQLGGRTVGKIGLLSAEVVKQYQVRAPVLAAEIDLMEVLDRIVPRVGEISKFPEVRRDIAILIDRDITASSLRQEIEVRAGASLLNLKLFDVYMGKGIDPEKKSVGLGLTFQHPSRTLTDDEVNTAMAAVIDGLSNRFQAQLR
jgi:phenylalanyl-tRNA synthetase beta chain